jgi:putative OPT family oligopeptide transporter
MEDQSFHPYIPADRVAPEMTTVSVVLGAILAIVFGAANAYLGLRVGMTISASIPAAVLSMGIIRFILKRDSILENNMVQTIGSAGESVAAGAIFTLPALFMWAQEGIVAEPSMLEIGLIALFGGLLGILFMVPLRRALIVKEHGVLAYPEGQACAEVLIAGEEGGAKASTVFAGLGIAAVYKFIADGLKLFPSEVHTEIPGYKGAGFGLDVLPALAGVGYICGFKVSSYMFAGGVLAWFVIMPMIAVFGSGAVLFPAKVTVAELLAKGGSFSLWGTYIRYIGAGAVLTGGLIGLLESLPLIIRTFHDALGDFGQNGESTLRTEQDLSMKTLLAGILIIIVALWAIPTIPLNAFGALLVAIFGFFFATVSSRMVGLIGSSNNPVSGMAIATLLVSTLLLKNTGSDGAAGMVTAISIGGIICVVAAIAGDISQDLKTGFLVGATPKKQQIGEMIGVVCSAIAIGSIMYLLNSAWGYGSAELPAPQAMLMKMVVEGVMMGNLPWNLVLIGVFLSVAMWILGIPVLAVAIGIYLPIHLSAPIMVGGLLRRYVESRKFKDDTEKNNCVQSGVLYSSGLIAGEGLVGILLAVFAVMNLDLDISKSINLGNVGGIVFFAVLVATIYAFCQKGRKARS